MRYSNDEDDGGGDIAGFVNLVRVVGRVLYEDIPWTGDKRFEVNYPRGLAVVVLDLMTRVRGWTKEQDVAKRLRLHAKQARKVLKLLSDDALLLKEERRQNTGQGVRTAVYYQLSLAHFADVTQIRMVRMRQRLEKKIKQGVAVQQYVCPTCEPVRRFSSLDAASLLDMATGTFVCSACSAELEVEKATAGSGAAMGSAEHRQEQRRLLTRFEETVEKPVRRALAALEGARAPTAHDLDTFFEMSGLNAEGQPVERPAGGGGGPGGGTGTFPDNERRGAGAFGAGALGGTGGEIDGFYDEQTALEIDLSGALPSEVERKEERERAVAEKKGREVAWVARETKMEVEDDRYRAMVESAMATKPPEQDDAIYRAYLEQYYRQLGLAPEAPTAQPLAGEAGDEAEEGEDEGMSEDEDLEWE